MTPVKSANQEGIREWVIALRSGEYTQAEKALKTPTGNCCLGVACEIAPDELGRFSDTLHQSDDDEGWAETESFDFLWKVESGVERKENGYLPSPIARWLQFSAGNMQTPLVLLTDAEYYEAGEEGALSYCSVERNGDERLHFMQLTACNDIMGWDFDKIAELVERTYL